MKFEIGLTLTGTVSAGAYTGGVLDFIIDAFEEWEKEKAKNRELYGTDYSKWTVPWHEVVIKGLSGASGGGVTSGLIVNEIGKPITPVRVLIPGNNTSNVFYNTWVNQLGINQLLDTKDLNGGTNIKSLLNSNALPDIANNILLPTNFGNTIKRPYIDEHLVAILTLTNLRGIPYVIPYYGVQRHNALYYRHADYAQFELATNNQLHHPNSYLIPYDTSNSQFSINYQKLKEACLATCAFPGAFKVQPFFQQASFYDSRSCPQALYKFQNEIYAFLNSDGGILNTEPFVLLHDFMLNDAIKKGNLPAGTTQNPRDPENVFQALILVAPLEIDEVFDEQNYPIHNDNLAPIALDAINAIRQEAIFSAEEICLAFDETVYSRYMIAPSRSSSPTANDFMKPAITGTTLGTFGAFISEDFRQHDYFLGRRNAQQFLRAHFAVPVDKVTDNPVFGPLHIRQQYSKYIFNDNGTDYFPIIPMCGAVVEDAYFPAWPTGKGYDMDDIRNRISNRVNKLTEIITSSLHLNWFEKLFASVIEGKVKFTIVDSAVKSISDALINANL